MEYWIVEADGDYFCVRLDDNVEEYTEPYLCQLNTWSNVSYKRGKDSIFFNSRRWIISALKTIDPKVKMVEKCIGREVWKS